MDSSTIMKMATARRTETRDRAAPSAITAGRRSVGEAVEGDIVRSDGHTELLQVMGIVSQALLTLMGEGKHETPEMQSDAVCVSQCVQDITLVLKLPLMVNGSVTPNKHSYDFTQWHGTNSPFNCTTQRNGSAWNGSKANRSRWYHLG